MIGCLCIKWVNVYMDEVFFCDIVYGFLSWVLVMVVVVGMVGFVFILFVGVGV